MIYLKIIKNADFTKFKNVLNELNKITGKNKVILFIDIIFAFVLHGSGYHDYYYYEFYNLSYKERKTILTRVKNNKIIKKFNDKNYAYVLENKFLFMSTFYEYTNRDFIKLDDNEKDFIKLLKKNKKMVLKPLNESGGRGVELITYKNDKDAKKKYENAINNNQLLAEGYVVQHEGMNKLYDKTINTLRVFTFYNDGNPKVVYSILKIGVGELKDNFAAGGMYVQLDGKGKVISKAIDEKDNVFTNHPVSNIKYEGFVVPLFDEVIKLTTSAAKIIKEIKYIGWDVAISKDGPVLIEGNYYPGIFQMKPSLTKDYKLASHLEKELNIKL